LAETPRTITSPYRICPLGAHVDHQGGRMLATAVDVGTSLEFTPADRLELESENYPGVVEFDPAMVSMQVPPEGIPEWGRYAWASLVALRDRLPKRPRAFRGRIGGRLPGAGLSSSASVLLAYVNAWADVNDCSIEPVDQVRLVVNAENDSIGVACGVLDPAAIVGSRKGHLLEIDSDTISWESLALGVAAPKTCFLVFATGKERNLASTDFNRRVGECRDAARWASDALSIDACTRLGDVPREHLRSVVERMPDPLRSRARHFVTECDRVAEGATAWRAGDVATFGRLMNASCRSSIENYETGSQELVALQEIWERTAGVLGARFSGAGFGGCSIALVRSERAKAIGVEVKDRFVAAFPSLGETADWISVESADGLGIR